RLQEGRLTRIAALLILESSSHVTFSPPLDFRNYLGRDCGPGIRRLCLVDGGLRTRRAVAPGFGGLAGWRSPKSRTRHVVPRSRWSQGSCPAASCPPALPKGQTAAGRQPDQERRTAAPKLLVAAQQDSRSRRFARSRSGAERTMPAVSGRLFSGGKSPALCD